MQPVVVIYLIYVIELLLILECHTVAGWEFVRLDKSVKLVVAKCWHSVFMVKMRIAGLILHNIHFAVKLFVVLVN